MQRRYGYDWFDRLVEMTGMCLLIGVIGAIYLGIMIWGCVVPAGCPSDSYRNSASYSNPLQPDVQKMTPSYSTLELVASLAMLTGLVSYLIAIAALMGLP